MHKLQGLTLTVVDATDTQHGVDMAVHVGRDGEQVGALLSEPGKHGRVVSVWVGNAVLDFKRVGIRGNLEQGLECLMENL